MEIETIIPPNVNGRSKSRTLKTRPPLLGKSCRDEELFCYLSAFAITCWGVFVVELHRLQWESADFAFALVSSALALGVLVVNTQSEGREWWKRLWYSGLFLTCGYAVGASIGTRIAWHHGHHLGDLQTGSAALLGAFVVGVVYESASERSYRKPADVTALKVGVAYLLGAVLLATFGLVGGTGPYYTFVLMTDFGGLVSAALLILRATRSRPVGSN